MRLVTNFGGFDEPSWIENRPKIDSKRYQNMHAKKESKKQRIGGILSRLGHVFAWNQWGLGGARTRHGGSIQVGVWLRPSPRTNFQDRTNTPYHYHYQPYLFLKDKKAECKKQL